ncbi:MAG: hypothetical protein K8F91_10055 [Candidatus Obscuribacterales bacterium]|nr:hypothetical protein [Candidatus Obscuribacterales bacterium]
MLFEKDSIYGHVIVDTDSGPIYEDDGSPVDKGNLRACKGCKLKIASGSHDPCIANLPGTYQACCGHGLDRSPVHNNPNGYVGLKDGRTISFSGLLGGQRIKQAVELALSGKPLPEGFEFGQRMWWEGLSEVQRAYVQERIPADLARLVSELATPSQAFLDGTEPWWDGLSPTQKDTVWAALPQALAQLVQESLANA